MKTLHTIVIEGNLGAGKTTLLKDIAGEHPEVGDKLKILVNPEPLEEWNRYHTFANFRRDRQQFACLFQNKVINTITESFIQKIGEARDLVDRGFDVVLVLERSLGSGEQVFLRQAEAAGHIHREFADALRLLRNYCENLIVNIAYRSGFHLKTSYIFLSCETALLLERIILRDREEERNVTRFELEEIDSLLTAYKVQLENTGHFDIAEQFTSDFKSTVLDFIFTESQIHTETPVEESPWILTLRLTSK